MKKKMLTAMRIDARIMSGVRLCRRKANKTGFTNTPENAKSCTQTCNFFKNFLKIGLGVQIFGLEAMGSAICDPAGRAFYLPSFNREFDIVIRLFMGITSLWVVITSMRAN